MQLHSGRIQSFIEREKITCKVFAYYSMIYSLREKLLRCQKNIRPKETSYICIIQMFLKQLKE